MGRGSPEILAYITGNESRVKTGNALTLVIICESERKACVLDIARALKADVVQLKNGDYMLIGRRFSFLSSLCFCK
jgi:siroheme synthase